MFNHIPLGGRPETQHSSRLAAERKPSVYPAWRPTGNPAFIPLGGRPETQHSSRLAAARKPSVYPAWQPSGNPAFIPLGGCPETQRLSRLAAARKPSVYPAWRLPHRSRSGRRRPGGLKPTLRKASVYPAWRPTGNPAFIPLGDRPETQRLSRLAHKKAGLRLLFSW